MGVERAVDGLGWNLNYMIGSKANAESEHAVPPRKPVFSDAFGFKCAISMIGRRAAQAWLGPLRSRSKSR